MPRQQHDPLTYIGPERQVAESEVTESAKYSGTVQATAVPANLPIPVGIFMNMAHVPPRFYNQHQQLMAQVSQSDRLCQSQDVDSFPRCRLRRRPRRPVLPPRQANPVVRGGGRGAS